MAILTIPHERALTLLFAELEGAAEEQEEAFLGTPGSLAERTNEAGVRFWVHRYSDATGRRHEVYLGKSNDAATTDLVATLRGRIATANATIARVRILARAGFATVDRKTYATLASLHNHSLFRAGALLIGSHAYGALLNALGVRAAAYATEDVDVGRREALALPRLEGGLLQMLRETGIPFFEVSSLNRRAPSTSFAERGGSRLRVDLLVPSSNDEYPTVPIPELGAHAKGVPHLAYLLGHSQHVPVLSPHGVVMVRVPVPERFAVHKLIVSQLRTRGAGKSENDLTQAATLMEAVSERFPGAVEDALAAAPRRASKHIVRAVKALQRHLPAAAENAWEALRSRKPRR
jgi:hypothetical protein